MPDEDRGAYVDFAERAAGGVATALEGHLPSLQDDLIMADMGYSLHEYLSMAVFSAGLVFLVATPAISMIVGVTTGSVQGIVSGLIMGLFISLFMSVAVFMVFYIYPSMEVSRRRTNIDNNLPFATMYLSTIAGTGTPSAALFQLLGSFDEYGEVSRESQKIARDVYNFGAGTTQALRGAAQRTPSDKFRELLWGINSIITTGGDLRSYLREKSEAYMADYRRSLDKFTDTLSLLVEMYITLVIVGSVFLIIITTIMSALSGTEASLLIAIQLFTVLFLLPIAAVMFIVIVKGVSPLE